MEYICWHVTGHVKHQMMRKLFNIIFIYPSCVMMHLFSTRVLALSLLMASPPLVSASVLNSFKDCSHFFYMQTPPAGMKGTGLRRICQRYANKLRYAMLYDSSCRLPLYSAYIFKKSDGKKGMDKPWMYEPQVEKAALCIWFICHLMLSLRKADCFWAIMTLKL